MSKRTIRGVVTSDKADKTIVVTRTSRETHPLYGKKFTRSRKFRAHDEKNAAKLGDVVVIEESAPISATKTWILKEIVERGQEMIEVKETEIEAEMAAKLDKTDKVEAEDAEVDAKNAKENEK